jgi:hypothetical protein
MKIRKSTKCAHRTSDATLESRYRDVRRLRDDVRKAETICVQRSKKTLGLEATCSSERPTDQSVRPIRNSSTFFPDLSWAPTQRGCFPRPDQVSKGISGFWYFGRTFG